jgi:hypothetical protein
MILQGFKGSSEMLNYYKEKFSMTYRMKYRYYFDTLPALFYIHKAFEPLNTEPESGFMNKMSDSKITKNKKRLMALVAALFAALVILSLGEGLCRIYRERESVYLVPPKAVIDPYRKHPYIVYRKPFIYLHIPRAEYVHYHPRYKIRYRVNSKGFRGPEIRTEPMSGKRRLLILGDSIAEGQGCNYNETFPFLLKRSLAPIGWEVVNCGVQGASPIYYAANMDRYAYLNPQAVLLVIYDNDLWEDRIRESYYFSLPWMDSPASLVTGTTPSPMLRFRLLLVLDEAWSRIRKPFISADLENLIRRNLLSRPTNDEQKALAELSRYLVAPSLFDQQWQMSRAYLDYVVKRWREKKVRVLITNLSLLNLAQNKPEAFRRHSLALNDRAVSWAKSENLQIVSLVPHIEDYMVKNGPAGIIIPQDGHPTPGGHRLIESILRPWLIKELSENN